MSLKVICNILFTTFWLTFLSCSKSADSTDSLTKLEVNTIIEDWIQLWATYDLEKIDDIFWQGPEMTYFSSEKEGLIKGVDSLITHHEGFGFVAGGTQKDNKLWLEDMSITIFGTSGIASGIWFFGNPESPSEANQRGPVTFVLTRNDLGEVRIIHAYFGNYD